MQAVTSVSEDEQRERRTCEDRLRRLTMGPRETYSIDFRDGVVEVYPIDKVYEARVRFLGNHGHVILTRGPYVRVSTRVNELVVDGIDVPPTYEGGRSLSFVRFPSDNSGRAVHPCGELRIKEFLNSQVAMVVRADRSLRIAALNEREDALVMLAESMAEDWAARPRLFIRFRGQNHEIRVSNIEGELGMCRINEYTKLVLVPHALGPNEAQARMALELVQGDDVKQLAVLPVLFEGSRDVVIWSDEAAQVLDRAPRVGPEQKRPVAPPPQTTAPRASAKPLGPLPEEVRPLVAQYIEELREIDGAAKKLRQESQALMRCVQNAARFRGCGTRLRRDLERAGDFTVHGGVRTFQYFVKQLADHGILARDCPGTREREFVFDELHDTDSVAVAQLRARYGVPPPSRREVPTELRPGRGVGGHESPKPEAEHEPTAESVRSPQGSSTAAGSSTGNNLGAESHSQVAAPAKSSSPTPVPKNEVPGRDPRVAPQYRTIRPLYVWSPPGTKKEENS